MACWDGYKQVGMKKKGNRIVKNIPTNRLSVVEQQEHMHNATEPEDDDDKDESSCS